MKRLWLQSRQGMIKEEVLMPPAPPVILLDSKFFIEKLICKENLS